MTTTDTLAALHAAVAAGDLAGVAALADSDEEAGLPGRAEALRALAAGPAGPELAAWRACVRGGVPAGRRDPRPARRLMVPAAGLMVLAAADLLDRGDGRGPVACLRLQSAAWDGTLTWYSSAGWAGPWSADEEEAVPEALAALAAQEG